ncbi:MAG TPA: YceI family protein [Balneolaceae bacterium]|nr:YceI family protein [Balneolaceae bacterium]
MDKVILSYIVLLFLFPVVSPAQAFKTETGHVEFHSTVPLHSFTGKSNHLVGKISLPDSTVDFYVDVHTLKTGIGMRDDDMMETLDAENHSFADFYGKLISSFDPTSSNVQKATVRGKFSVHGVSKQVMINGTMQQTEKGLQVKASWTLDMTDYKIKPPSILFYRVSDTVDISIDATLPNVK